MMHTIVNEAEVFTDCTALQREVRCINGVLLEGIPTPNGFCMERLLSTDPEDYLRDFSFYRAKLRKITLQKSPGGQL